MRTPRYKSPKKTFKQRLGKALVIIGLLIAALFVYIDVQMQPIIERTADYQCKVLTTGIVNSTILNELDNELYDYSSLITLRENADGDIISIESNMININRLKARTTELINEAIKNISDFDIYIPLGTISGISPFYGRGPKIPVNIIPYGNINTSMTSKFSSAGINQTLHSIVMEVEMDLSAVIPGFSQTVNVKTELVIAETVIVGEVPDTYLSF